MLFAIPGSACPAGRLAHAREGDFEQAWRTLVADDPLPGVHIHAVERFVGDMAASQKGWTVPTGAPTGKKVLIVGAGPATASNATIASPPARWRTHDLSLDLAPA